MRSRTRVTACGRGGKTDFHSPIAVLPDEVSGDYDDDWKWDGWARICPPDSPIRKYAGFDERIAKKQVYKPPKQRSFIRQHPQAMDLCYHPENQLLHGFAAWSVIVLRPRDVAPGEDH